VQPKGTTTATARADQAAGSTAARPLESITPSQILTEFRRGVLGQDEALRYVAVAVYKHTTGKVPGNIMLIGNSGTGKTTIMSNIQRLYHDLPEYAPFRAMAIINANLLVDSDRMEFRPDRLLSAVEQRARAIIGHAPTAEELKATMERATICIDEIDKMSSIVAGRPNAIGVVLQQGLLTLMEGDIVPFRAHVVVDGEERPRALEINTAGMMFISGGAFEGLFDQDYLRVTNPGSGEKLRSVAIRGVDGQVRIETRFALSDYFRIEDLFVFGMVPQFTARFDSIVLLSDLGVDVLKEILLRAFDSPFVRSQNYMRVMGIELELEDEAAALIAEQAERHSRTGARALRTLFGKVINPYEFDPACNGELPVASDGSRRLAVTARMVRQALGL
jgi:ATP-dependent Clp protease ATP-binding subunit ClpX